MIGRRDGRVRSGLRTRRARLRTRRAGLRTRRAGSTFQISGNGDREHIGGEGDTSMHLRPHNLMPVCSV